MKKLYCNKEKCLCCGGCIGVCPVNALSLEFDKELEINYNKCVKCGKCVKFCPVRALKLGDKNERHTF